MIKWTPYIERYPRPFLLKTLELFHERGLKSIVEIGSMRGSLTGSLGDPTPYNGGNDGFSSLYWATATDEFVTVDIDWSAIENVVRECKKHCGKDIIAFCMDGIEYLEKRNSAIDLLFLDFYDADLPGSAENHLDAFKISEKDLHGKSLVLVDDCDVYVKDGVLHLSDEGTLGKGRLLIPYALEKGWKILLKGRQVLLSK